MEKIKQFLGRYPPLDRIVRRIYLPLAYKYLGFRRHLNRNRLSELWARGYYHQAKTAVQNREAINQPHRSFLVSRVASFSPVASLLEIGCDSGPNLYLLAQQFPQAEIRGIDINPRVVKMGNDWFAAEGISNVKLSLGRAEVLGAFSDKSFDVVFTDAVLIYVSRDTIYGVIQDMVRLARHGLILVEYHDFAQQLNDKQGLGVFIDGHWVRDYVALLKQFIPAEQICVTRLGDLWPGGNWGKYGAIVEVTL